MLATLSSKQELTEVLEELFVAVVLVQEPAHEGKIVLPLGGGAFLLEVRHPLAGIAVKDGEKQQVLRHLRFVLDLDLHGLIQ